MKKVEVQDKYKFWSVGCLFRSELSLTLYVTKCNNAEINTYYETNNGMADICLFCKRLLLIFGTYILTVHELLDEMIDFGLVNSVMFLPTLPRMMRVLSRHL